jgi:hypothetical protein
MNNQGDNGEGDNGEGDNGEQAPAYGPQNGAQYGPQENGYGRPDVKPGESYDPSLYNGPGKADDSYGRPENSRPQNYWKDDKRYPQGGANFPEYVPSTEEEDPQEPTEPEVPNGNGEVPNGEPPNGGEG